MGIGATISYRQDRTQRLQLSEAQRSDDQRRQGLRALHSVGDGVLRLSREVQGEIRRGALREDPAPGRASDGSASPRQWRRRQPVPWRADEARKALQGLAERRIPRGASCALVL